jgi:hypothetical protein
MEQKTKINAEDGKQELVITREFDLDFYYLACSLLLLILTVVSWYFRPADRKIISVKQ